jgi:hypothetical protein
MLLFNVKLLLVFILMCSAEIAHAQRLAPSPESFQLEWRPRSEHMMPGIEGYVYNPSDYRIGSVRLKVEVLDKDGRVKRLEFAWVYGVIDAGGRGYFVLRPLRPEETCRITVESFDLLSRQAP